jgi:hypothetical protein
MPAQWQTKWFRRRYWFRGLLVVDLAQRFRQRQNPGTVAWLFRKYGQLQQVLGVEQRASSLNDFAGCSTTLCTKARAPQARGPLDTRVRYQVSRSSSPVNPRAFLIALISFAAASYSVVFE